MIYYANKQLIKKTTLIFIIRKMLSAIISFLAFFIFGCSQIFAPNDGCDSSAVPKPLQGIQQQSFDQFLKTYQKDYRSSAQQIKRCKIFYENIEKMRQKAKMISWKIGVNTHSDLTDEQIRRFRGLTKRKKRSRRIRKKRRTNLRAQPIDINQFPSSLNWTQLGMVTSVKQQGMFCNSCVAFSTTGYGESKLIIEGKASTSIDLSEQFLMDCTENINCLEGGFVEEVMETASILGVPPQDQFPYLQKDSIVNTKQCSRVETILFGNIPKAQYSLSDEEIINLLQRGPLAASVTAEDWFDYESGVFECYPYSQHWSYDSVDPIDHSGLLVGYTPDYWIFKNQWGTEWGEDGYIKITRQRIRNCEVTAEIFYVEDTPVENQMQNTESLSEKTVSEPLNQNFQQEQSKQKKNQRNISDVHFQGSDNYNSTVDQISQSREDTQLKQDQKSEPLPSGKLPLKDDFLLDIQH